MAAAALPAVATATTPGANGRIVFSSTRDGSSNADLYSVVADGSGLARLTWSPTTEQHPAWSPDGTQIAFGSFAEGRQSIHVMDADGSDEHRVSPDFGVGVDDMEPAWSPDGGKIAFASTRPFNQSWHVWVMNADGSEIRQLTSEFATAPAWSPDGHQIAFLGAGGSISVMNSDGTGARTLTFPPAGYSDERPSWSPNGSSLVFARRQTFGDDPQLYAIDADGSNERQLTFGDAASRFPAWSPDGEAIVFTRDRQVHVMNADGSGTRPLAPGGFDLTPDWGTSTAVPNPQVPGAPTIEIYSPENRVYPAGFEVPAVYECRSETSFVISCEGDVPFGEPLDMETTGLRTFTVRATDLEGRTSTKTVTFEVLDWRAPTVIMRTPTEGAEYAVQEVVEVDYECADEPGGSGIALCGGELEDGQPLDTSDPGSFTYSFWALDRNDNLTVVSVTYSVVDRTPPATITIESPHEGAVYLLGETVVASYACDNAVSCDSDAVDTASVGAKSFTVRARGRDGNVVTASRNYRVVYPFSGFFSPLAPFPATASVDAGESVPAKFSLGGDYGLGVLRSATWSPVECGTGEPRGDRSAATGRLSFHGARYHYLVGTSASWAGCWQLGVTLDDGTTRRANVIFG